MYKKVDNSIPFQVKEPNSEEVIYSGYSISKFFKAMQIVTPSIDIMREYSSDKHIAKHINVRGFNNHSLTPVNNEYVFFYEPSEKLSKNIGSPTSFRFLMNGTLIFVGSLDQFEEYLHKHYCVISISKEISNIEELIIEDGEVKAKVSNPVITMQYQKEKDVISCMSFSIKTEVRKDD